MNKATHHYPANWYKQQGATDEEIANVERAAGVEFPDDYKRFLKWSNGGEGKWGSSYLSLWNTTELAQLNEDYAIRRYVPQLLAIGTDGGSQCYALDYRDSAHNPALVRVPLGDLDTASLVAIGDSFLTGLSHLENEAITA